MQIFPSPPNLSARSLVGGIHDSFEEPLLSSFVLPFRLHQVQYGFGRQIRHGAVS
jgi:hypothetical protein